MFATRAGSYVHLQNPGVEGTRGLESGMEGLRASSSNKAFLHNW